MPDYNGATVRQIEGPAPEPVKIALPEDVMVPAALLLAAESVAGEDDAAKILLQAKDGQGRVVSNSGGDRLFLGSFPLPEPVPSWMHSGLMLYTEGLKARLGFLTKLDSTEAWVRISYAVGGIHAEMTDKPRSVTLRLELVAGEFGNYERVFAQSFTTLGPNGERPDRDWQALGFNSKYLKQVGEIAKLLESGLDKSQRSKEGMVVRAFTGGDETAPMMFDFPTWPGALLGILPAEFPAPISKQTVTMLAPAIRGSIAALTAHVTRNRAWGDASSDETVKAQFYAKAAEFEQRVAALRTKLPGIAIAAKPADTPPSPPVETPEDDEDAIRRQREQDEEDALRMSRSEDDDAPEPEVDASRPKTTRTRINVAAA